MTRIHSSTAKRKTRAFPYEDFHTVLIQKIQTAVRDKRIKVSEIVEPISNALSNVADGDNSRERLRRKLDALSNSVSQVLKSYDIPSMNIGHSLDMINPESLEIRQEGLYKNHEDDSVRVENILDVLWMLDPVDEILLNLVNKIIEEIDPDLKKIKEIGLALEWIKGIAHQKICYPRRNPHAQSKLACFLIYQLQPFRICKNTNTKWTPTTAA